jgi:8-oxo-dGTP pyrophosphatase MutT (NUDIX family)
MPHPHHKWVLPKGIVNKDESLEQAALREVREETGVQTRIVESLGDPEKYVYTARGVRVFKSVHYFLMEYISGSEADHDHEMEEVKWVAIDAAIEMMGYRGAKEVLIRSKAKLENMQSRSNS